MGNKAPATASELNKINTLLELKKYLKTHEVLKKSDIYDQQVDEIIVKCLEAPMPLEVFKYLIDKIDYWSLMDDYKFFKKHIKDNEKSMCLLALLPSTLSVDFIKSTDDIKILTFMMHDKIKNGTEWCVNTLIPKFKNLRGDLAQFHKEVVGTGRVHIIELFVKHDKTFKLEDHYDKNGIRDYYKNLNRWNSND